MLDGDNLPAEPTTVGAYLAARADGLAVATLNRRIAAITAAHRMVGQGLDGRRVRRLFVWRHLWFSTA